MVAFLGIIGIVTFFLGLVSIANHVRVHRIEVYNAGTWLARVGAAALLVPMVLDSTVWGSVGIAVAVCALGTGLLTGHHEWLQAKEGGATSMNWRASLAAQLLGMSAALGAVGVIGQL